ncbi:unnamed protein product [Medioppia subpectinata]|uniref:Myb/SANT-like DNA-binding domain-containing protein n=1 Tax=Medioppia subpectinata TaxID=1979941 RepID=A0A7R9Q188_9ACAR|nr:unnamed protein product [Medioppia subpectinata]CAG2108291.1 unnamed protein product [Medioppia subpectinata]
MNTFKVLVDINDEKFCVFIQSDHKIIQFKTVFTAITAQTKHTLNADDHSFEIFDTDFEEWVVVNNCDQIIDNLAKIRVRLKDNKRDANRAFNETNSVSQDSQTLPKNVNTLATVMADAGGDRVSLTNTNSEVNNNAVIEQKAQQLNPLHNQLSQQKPCLEKNLVALDINFDNLNIKSTESASNETTDKKSNIDHIFSKMKKTINTLKDERMVAQKAVTETDLLNGNVLDNETMAEPQAIASNNGNSANKWPPNAVNYLDLTKSHNYCYSSDCLHVSHKTIVTQFRRRPVIAIRYHHNDFKAIDLLLELLEINRRCFERNSSNDSENNPKWRTISQQMINNGFENWSPEQCRNGFHNVIELYKKTLNKCPDSETATKVNPMFSALHWFDMKYLVNLCEFNQIRDLRQAFKTKPHHKSKEYGLIGAKKFGSNMSLLSNSNDNKTCSKYGSNGSLASNQTIPKTKTKYQTNKDIVETVKLNKVTNLSKSRINEFKTLANSVQTIVGQFGHCSRVHNFWDLVANQMRANGYDDSAQNARNIFTEFVCDYYALVLIRCPDYMNATEVYPLFAFIHAMDLSQCLSQFSFEKIKDLRDKFAAKM